MTTTNQFIDDVLSAHDSFSGVFNTSNIGRATYKTLPSHLVCNLSGRDSPGTHWIGIEISEKSVLYFDPLGGPCETTNILKFMVSLGFTRYEFLTTPLQGLLSTHCGYFVMAFFIARWQGLTLHQFMRLLNKSDTENDRTVYDIVSLYHDRRY